MKGFIFCAVKNVTNTCEIFLSIRLNDWTSKELLLKGH